jgi:hypothetical protein
LKGIFNIISKRFLLLALYIIDKFQTEIMAYGVSIDFILFLLTAFVLFVLLFMNICDDDLLENFDSYKNREERIKDLNDSRGKTGNFYVKCHACGRKRILQDRKKICNRCSDTAYCLDSCKEGQNEKMSFFNNKYIDKDQIFCYNCLMDNDHNNRYFLKNYVYWPSMKDPVNGPPYV